MSTPPQEPLVPPSLPPTPGADEYPQQGQPYAPPAYPPPGYPAAYGYPAPAWGPPQPAWGAPDARALNDAEAGLRKARTALGWSIGAAVGAGLALLLAVVALLVSGVSADDGYSYDPLRSEVSGLADGATLGGDRLASAVTDLLRSVGSQDVGVTCPDTEAVTVSTAVVCTGDVDGSAWTGIVFFEDTKGTFVVLEV